MFWIGVAVLVLGLVFSIAWHELGHLLPAKRFGVYVTQYMVGFGPTLFSRRRAETEYGVKAIPLGGYIRMVGMYPGEADLSSVRAARRDPTNVTGLRRWLRTVSAEAREFSAAEVPPGAAHRTFAHLTVPRKLAVMFGGPLSNLVLAFILLAVAYLGIGIPVATTTIGAVSPCLTSQAECQAADPASPAAAAGIEPGDEIVSWDGAPATDWASVQARIRSGGAVATTVVVERAGEQLELEVTPVLAERQVEEDGAVVTREVPVVGITPTSELRAASFGTLTTDYVTGIGETFRAIVTLPAQLVSIVGSTFGTSEREPGLIGLVGVGRLAGEATSTESDFGVAGNALVLLQVLASLNIALFAFNMIPLLPLDGGHIAGALWEGGRRRLARWRGRPDPGPVDVARLLPLTYVVILGMLVMFVLLTLADIVDPLSLTG